MGRAWWLVPVGTSPPSPAVGALCRSHPAEARAARQRATATIPTALMIALLHAQRSSKPYQNGMPHA